MTTDELITSDLGELRRESRDRIPAIDVSLRVLAAPAAPRVDEPIELTLLRHARVFSVRVAWIATGTAGLLCALALIAYLAYPRDFDDYYGWPASTLEEILSFDTVTITLIAMLPIVLAHLVAARRAERMFDRAMRDATDRPARARQLVERVDRWAIAITIAGMLAVVIACGMLRIVLGDQGLISLKVGDARVPAIRGPMEWNLIGAIAAATLGAILVARSRVLRGFGHRLAIAAGLVVVGVTLYLGLRFDVGTLHGSLSGAAPMPSTALRAVLTATGTLGLFLIITGIVVRVRSGEQALLGQGTRSTV